MGRQQGSFHWSSGRRAIEKDYDQKVLAVANQQLYLVLNSFSINRKIEMPEETPNFNINPDTGMTPATEFTYCGRRVEIVSPDTAHLIWQIKIDGVLRGNYVFSTAREAADEARKLIDRNEE
jgi:hypothetical protein